ncbi:IS66 family transposase [Shewanella vesiculosa]|mgnify:CR=1 FL=1|uniref:IS66 family transposase n=1 Tax=Shewanella TaxID=22 RepID=UPI000F50526D|nr:IS66 family transposase [Shewanella vesiculosa]RPA32813.1 IS66 family transposase [Shewanella vesiculosa]
MTDLPDDIAQLKAMLLQLQQENDAQKVLLQAKQEQVSELQTQIELLIEQLNLSKSKRFSSQSEKVAKGTFNEAEQQHALPNVNKSKAKTGRKPLPEALEREVYLHELSAPCCECCQTPLHECGKEVSEELKIIPQKVSVIRHERTKYTCRQCEKTHVSNKVITAPKPASMLPKSMGSAETFAAIVTAKYVDALPLYRQVDMLNRSGIDISRGTLANWCVQLGDKVQVIIDAMKDKLLSEKLICADETTVQVLREEDRKAETKSYMWVYRSGEFAENPAVIYDYQPSRAAACVKDFLTGYSGYLLTDGYSAYNTLEQVTQAACMAHARRKFTDAQKASPSKKAGKPEKALSYIAKLYGIEKQAKHLTSQARQQLRTQQAEPILNEFYAWLNSQHVLPKGALGKAITYTINQWPKLLTYLEDGDISIDNNVTERDIRPFTTGRKNWMFSTSVGGAKASANLYSLVMTCRANDLNPYYYFRHLFTELPKRAPLDDMTDLLPWNVDLGEAE